MTPLRPVSSLRLIVALAALFGVVAIALALRAADGAGSQGSPAAERDRAQPQAPEPFIGRAKRGGARNLDIGFVDGQFSDNLLTNEDPAVRKKWFKRLKKANAKYARINVYWSQTAGGSPPAAPRDPNDPSYEWGRTDAAVLSAAQQKVPVLLTVLAAPVWAEGPDRPADVRSGAWRPNAQALGDFGAAMARRYSGKYVDNGVKLPKVRYYEAWNEPNLPNYISPQWNGKKPVATGIYKKMVNAFYKSVHSVGKKNRVVAGGTSPFGDRPGGKRIRPNYFWREVLCLTKKLKKKKGCKGKVRIDIYATNSINAQGKKKMPAPTSKPPHPDDSVPSNFGKLGKAFKAAKKKKTLISATKKVPGWSTETWYEGKPGDPRGVSPKKQARYQQQSMYVLWKQGASAVFFLQLRDTPYDPAKPGLAGFQTGVYLANDKPKPSLTATRFPFVAERKSKKSVFLWGKAPRSGKLTVRAGKKKVTSLRVKRGKVFTKTVKLKKGKGKYKLRAKVGKSKSLTWAQK